MALYWLPILNKKDKKARRHRTSSTGLVTKNSFQRLLQLQVQNHKQPFYFSELSAHERSIFPQ